MSLFPQQPYDQHYMKKALRHASLGLGHTWPNPSVGCLLIDEEWQTNQVIALSRTAPGGRPHAEKQLLAKIGNIAKGKTLYVTLEPCAHQGKVISCTEAIIEAGIKRVVIGLQDPDPRTNGKGIARLIEAGIQVTAPCLPELAGKINQGFISRQKNKRPWVTLKIACSLDGKIADYNGDGRWVTNERSRKRAHLLRVFHDAIVTGIGTVLKDDPLLNCRLQHYQNRHPLRVIMDSNLRLPIDSKIVKSAHKYNTWVICSENYEPAKKEQLLSKGVDVYPQQNLDIPNLLSFLANQGLTSLLVEGGAKLAASFLNSQMVNWLMIFRAPIFLGEKGVSMTNGAGGLSIHAPYRMKRTRLKFLDQDLYEEYEPIISSKNFGIAS